MFEFDLLELTDGIEIVNSGKKTIYNIDDKKSARDWVKDKNGKITQLIWHQGARDFIAEKI